MYYVLGSEHREQFNQECYLILHESFKKQQEAIINVSFFLVKTQLKRKHFGSKQLFKECLWEREKTK